MAQHFDVTLKLLFRGSNGLVARAIFGGTVTEWLSTELPKIENTRLDMLARVEGRGMVMLELHSFNDWEIGRRALDYYVGCLRLYNEEVEPVVLYVGKEPLRMKPVFKTKKLTFEFTILDIRDFDGEPLLNSDDLADQMLALLTNADKERVISRVLDHIAKLEGEDQSKAAATFVIISGLRGLEPLVGERIDQRMSIDVMQNKILGPMIQRRLDEGTQQARQQGIHQGRLESLTRILRIRFGDLPQWATQLLDQANEDQLLLWTDRFVTASTLEQILG